MRLLIVICCWMLCAQLHATPLQVQPWRPPASKPTDAERFPVVEGTPAQAAAAARINTLLWTQNLGVLPPKNSRDAPRLAWDGLSDFGYDVLRNDERILSLAIHAKGCGAHCENVDRFHAFDTATGRQLQIDDLLTPAGRDALARQLRIDRTALMRTTIARLQRDLKRSRAPGESTELIEAAIKLYQDCMPRNTDTQLQGDERLGAWRIEAKALIFVGEPCSSHLMRPIDELDDFSRSVPFDRLAASLTAYGRRLLLGSGTAAAPETPFGQVLHGLIDGKLPITLVLDTPRYDGSVGASYFYLRFRQRIGLWGYVDGSRLTLKEELGLWTSAPRIEVAIDGATLTGRWIATGRQLDFKASP